MYGLVHLCLWIAETLATRRFPKYGEPARFFVIYAIAKQGSKENVETVGTAAFAEAAEVGPWQYLKGTTWQRTRPVLYQ